LLLAPGRKWQRAEGRRNSQFSLLGVRVVMKDFLEIDDAVVITIFATELSQVAIEGMKARRQQQSALPTAEVTQLTEKITQ
jgi:hypothetical protein